MPGSIPSLSVRNVKNFLTKRCVEIENMRGTMFDFDRAMHERGSLSDEQKLRLSRIAAARSYLYQAWCELIKAQSILSDAQADMDRTKPEQTT